MNHVTQRTTPNHFRVHQQHSVNERRQALVGGNDFLARRGRKESAAGGVFANEELTTKTPRHKLHSGFSLPVCLLCLRVFVVQDLRHDDNGAPLPPRRSPTISARIARATSSGETAPISRPIGARTFFSWSSEAPSSRSLSSTKFVRRLLPIIPT